VFDNTQSGSCIANECLLQCAAIGLPFGGTGASGSTWLSITLAKPVVDYSCLLDGQHTGKYTFDMFTHLRASLDSPSWCV